MTHRPKTTLLVLFALPLLLAGWFMTANLMVRAFWPMSAISQGETVSRATSQAYSPCHARKIKAQTARIERARAAALAAQVNARVRAEHVSGEVVAQRPHPSLSPTQVVRAQMEALRRPNFPRRDAGIARAFGFAAPANRAAVGPISRFTKLMRNSAYTPMLGNTSVSYDAPRVHGDVARQEIFLIGSRGERVVYEFHLRRQSGGAYDGSWMTTGVMRKPLR